MANYISPCFLVGLCAFLLIVVLIPTINVSKTSSRILAMQESIGISASPENLACRARTLKILKNSELITSDLEQQKEDNELQYVARCWQEALSFYITFPLDFGYGSHVLPLLASAWITEGDLCELGSGWYSTPMLHRIAQLQGRFLLTADSNAKWLQYFSIFASEFHHLDYVNVQGKRLKDAFDTKSSFHEVKAWSEVGNQPNWSLIFVDHAPGYQRFVDMARLRHNTDLSLVHDTDPKSLDLYGVGKGKILDSFKYKYVIGESWSKRHVHVLSDRRGDLVTAIGYLCDIGMKILQSTIDVSN